MMNSTLLTWLLALLSLCAVVAAPGIAFMWTRAVLPPPDRLAEKLAPDPQVTRHTVASRLSQFGEAARSRLQPAFQEANLPYPPHEIVMVGLKQERRLELYGRALDGELQFVKAYPFQAWTGRMGPKLMEGDRQIPEGVYGVEYLNPNSIAHVSLKIGYPNAFEKERGKEDGRTDLGGDIMIHGWTNGSQGCIVVTDADVEEIFTLASDTGLGQMRILLAPSDLRREPASVPEDAPLWTEIVYRDLVEEMARLPIPAIRVAGD
ncbi:L,D-transpeptidase family protein [Pacificispira sp.]|uniref:L,D-transpeptidase family protein n=1 Tax=Pacificispira sp. TaxID=2888761 RepID=UPI003BAD63D2